MSVYQKVPICVVDVISVTRWHHWIHWWQKPGRQTAGMMPKQRHLCQTHAVVPMFGSSDAMGSSDAN